MTHDASRQIERSAGQADSSPEQGNLSSPAAKDVEKLQRAEAAADSAYEHNVSASGENPPESQVARSSPECEAVAAHVYYQRFDPFNRFLHFLVIVSFLGLAITGLPLKFYYMKWAVFLANLLGGFKSAGYLHRVCAIITFFYFFSHIFLSIRFLLLNKRGELLGFLFGPESPVPSFRDAKDMLNHILFFMGKGPRPKWDFWTYWEKFDYWAVWWGVVIIGASGLFLWFPMFFTHHLPGWLCNIAIIIHSDEALLAIGFIFTIHFFNSHLRPEKFPIDTVIFTGAITEEEMKEERPQLYERLKSSGDLEALRIHSPLPEIVKHYRIFGYCALTVGILIIITVIFTELLSLFSHH